MQILYISSVPSEREFFRINGRKRDGANVFTYGMSEAGFKFHSLILEGLRDKKDIQILSLVGRSVSWKAYKGIFWKTWEEISENIRYRHLGLINIPGLKQFFLGLSFFFHTLAWMIRFRDETDKSILLDAAYISVLPAVLLAASTGRCRKAAVFCDIYEYMGDVRDARKKRSAIHRIARNYSGRQYEKLDAFILLTEAMDSVVNKRRKPHIVMEGLVDFQMRAAANRLEDKAPGHVILYAGALREQYGLKNLISGFMQFADDDASLWIYGAGDYSDAIRKASQEDPRIRFFGTCPNRDVVKREAEASLLINPRPIGQEFTKYSFPSKNMEYMVSGTPVLTTRLPGMPEEYDAYVYLIEGDSAEDIAQALKAVFRKSSEELFHKGEQAKNFVLEKKNNLVQTQRILNLLNEIR